MNVDNDRRAVILAGAAIAGLALAGSIVLTAIIVLRLDPGEDVAPGVAALVMALFGIASLVLGFLAPSPLSKSATAADAAGVTPVEVVNTLAAPVVTATADDVEAALDATIDALDGDGSPTAAPRPKPPRRR